MIFVYNNGSRDACLNLALEEFVLRQAPGGAGGDARYFLLYENDPAVILGRHQNVLQETDPLYLERAGVELVRRLSGGGTVYHGRGNLNFSFIMPGRAHLHDFAHFTDPIRRVLATFGIATTMRSNGSLFVGERKFSGHAQYVAGQRILSHGTLLFDADLDALQTAVQPRNSAIESKAVPSIRSNVLNLRPLFPHPLTLEAFRAALLQGVGIAETYVPGASDRVQIADLAERYRSWEWLHGRGHRYVVQKSAKFEAGTVEVRLEIERGLIRSAELYTDFFDRADPAVLAGQLVGQRYDHVSLRTFLATVDLEPTFGPVARAAFLQLLY